MMQPRSLVGTARVLCGFHAIAQLAQIYLLMSLYTEDPIPSNGEDKPFQEPSTAMVNGESTLPANGEAKEEQTTDSMSKYCMTGPELTIAKMSSKSTSSSPTTLTRSRSWYLPKSKFRTFDNPSWTHRELSSILVSTSNTMTPGSMTSSSCQRSKDWWQVRN